MEILSWQFAVFCAVVLAVYYLLGQKAQNIWLLAASYFFYASWSWHFPVILLASTLSNYLLAQWIEKRPRGKSAWLWVGIGINLGALVLFRLADRMPGGFVLPFALAPEVGESAGFTRFLLPVGFSFYTLQAISYLVDVSRRQVGACRNPIDFGVYMAYFPKLTAGPIERARSFLPLMAASRRVDNAAVGRGITLIATGLVRKAVIADTLSRFLPAGIFQDPGQFSSLQLAAGIGVYAFILYNDFAGYTDMVRGVSELFGIPLSPNFRQPYFSRGFVEFWNRWHLSLSFWLRDYIFFPLSRALLRRYPDPRHPLNLVLPPMVTMLASGLWHGLTLGMAAWGALHGVYQTVERLLTIGRPRKPVHDQPLLFQVAAWLVCFSLLTLAWVPFATNDFSNAIEYWRGLFAFSGGEPVSISFGWMLAFIGLSMGLDWVQYHAQNELIFLRWVRPAQALLLALAAVLLVFSMGSGMDVSGFVYQGF
jgi:D-alanyl-lipoteichoic acid acyltransferase DltB (MBOAT superfamily)